MEGKKVKGRKRHIVTDITGNLLGVHVHAANIYDTKGGCYVFAKTLKKYPSIEVGCADQGYGGTFKNTVQEFFKVRVDISERIKPKFEILSK